MANQPLSNDQMIDVQHAFETVEALLNYVSGLIAISHGNPDDDKLKIDRAEFEHLLHPMRDRLETIQDHLGPLVFDAPGVVHQLG